MIPGLTATAIVYFGMCYILYRIGSKFGPATLGEYFIPFYNVILLARYVGVSPWLALASSLPFFVGTFTWDPILVWASVIFAIVAGGYFWGTVARSLGKDFWMGALTLPLLGIPVLILAFDPSAQPVNAGWSGRAPDLPFQGFVPQPTSSLTLVCRSGEVKGQSLPVPASGLVIGRHPRNANLVLNSSEISSRHVRLTPNVDGRGVWVEDLQSTNGTYVAQSADSWSRLQGRRLLFEGNRFYLGKRVAEFEIRQA